MGSGFPLALSPNYDFALLGVVAAVLPAFLLILLLKKVFKRFMQKMKQPDAEVDGYNMEPWRDNQPRVQPLASHPVGDLGTPTRSDAPPQSTRQFL